MNVCKNDFGTQTSSFCSVDTFREVWLPVYRQVNNWIHKNTSWKTFKHSCGAVEKFIETFIEAGFDILNPVQCSATGMDPRLLKERYGGRIVFWGGGVDTQHTLPFGTPDEVRRQVLERCEIGARRCVQHRPQYPGRTPVKNIVALFEALRQARS